MRFYYLYQSKVKIIPSKKHVSSELKRTLEKRQKKGFKKLVKANKGCTFAPATTQLFFNKLTRIPNQKRKFIFEKRFAKACEIRKRVLHLHPAKQVSSLID